MIAELPVFASASDVAAAVRRLGRAISTDHPRGVVLVGVLKGTFCFLADLMRHLEVNSEVDFLALSAYSGSTTRVRILKDLDIELTSREVVLVEDIVDTGLSARHVLHLLADRGAASVRLCALPDRPARRILPLEVDYLGFEAPEGFLVGYGLDFAERYRNLRGIYHADTELLENDPSAYDVAAYPSSSTNSG